MPSSHMALNQGVEDQLLFDNSKSYFVDPGYQRTSNFQMELVDVEPVNNASLGQTIQFLLPQSGDLLGNMDLAFAFNKPTVNEERHTYSWVESVGYAMIDYAEFTVGSTVLQRVSGDQLNIMNELKQKNARQSTQVGTTGMSGMLNDESELPWSLNTGNYSGLDGYPQSDGAAPWSRVIQTPGKNGAGVVGVIAPDISKKEYHVPLDFFFTKSPGKYFPMAALHGVNDIRVTLRLRSLEELMQIGRVSSAAFSIPSFPSGIFKHFRLRCHYYSLSGPEATALASKEQVRLIEEWQHVREIKTFKCSTAGTAHKVDIDLNFLHPVKELIFTLRRASEMTPDVSSNTTLNVLKRGPAGKNYFAFHGDANGDPNIDGVHNKFMGDMSDTYAVNLDVNNIKLRLNGTERHNAINDGVSREYLKDMVVGRQRAVFGNNDLNKIKHSMVYESNKSGNLSGLRVDRAMTQLGHSHDDKCIFVYPLCIDPEGDNPSGSVNFSKVSHAKLSFDVSAFTGSPTAAATDCEFYIDVWAVSYNWLQIRDGRALVSFA